jgi:hypothetical protein
MLCSKNRKLLASSLQAFNDLLAVVYPLGKCTNPNVPPDFPNVATGQKWLRPIRIFLPAVGNGHKIVHQSAPERYRDNHRLNHLGLHRVHYPDKTSLSLECEMIQGCRTGEIRQ